MRMEFKQLKYFACLYREGSLTRASLCLETVQPNLSMQIAKLEKELGVRLFDRSRRGMSPTPAGHEAYRMLIPVYEELLAARTRFIEMPHGKAG
jgi:DNA-binding transcriptional LysR family regulator